MQMSDDAAALMRRLAEQYVARGFPNRKVWGISRPQGDRIFPELSALGLIEPMGRSFRLTAFGHQWVMENRPDLPGEVDTDDTEAQLLGEGPFFNLLVTASEGAWDNPHYIMDASRFLEYTDDGLRKRLNEMGPSAAKATLMKLPTLFAYETAVGAPARVGWVTDVVRRDRELRVGIRFDDALQPVLSERIEALVWELQISAWEMNRTHWAVKAAPLLDVLFGKPPAPAGTTPPYERPEHRTARVLEAFQALVGEEGLDAVERAVRNSIEDNEPAAGLDRLHTFTTRFLRAACEKRGVAAPRDKPLHSLLGEYLKALEAAGGVDSEMTKRILKTTISVMESFNDVRNNQSLAHDNELLNHNEALLIYNHVVNALRYIQELERLSGVTPA
jgi:hypothetical protein